eukprot:scaffold125903_cov34-Tisochrysis_lutea.AAC.1
MAVERPQMIPHFPWLKFAKSSEARNRMSDAMSMTSINCMVISEVAVLYFCQADWRFEKASTHMMSELKRATQHAKYALDVTW